MADLLMCAYTYVHVSLEHRGFGYLVVARNKVGVIAALPKIAIRLSCQAVNENDLMQGRSPYQMLLF